MSSTAPAPAPAAHNYVPKSGFDTSGSSGLYHKARPSYPPAALRAILSAGAGARADGTAQGLNILEIGSGTGISTEGLLRQSAASADGEAEAAPALSIARYLAVEPSDGMREGWDTAIRAGVLPQLKLSGALPGGADVRCVPGTFEDFSSDADAAPDSTWDLAVIAQAWHWCPAQDASLRRIARALRPGGALALIWNMEDRGAGAAWVGRLRDLYEVHEDNTPQYRHGYWKSMYGEPALRELFEEPLQPRHFTRMIPTTVQGVKDRVLSKSYISVLSQEKQHELMRKVDSLFEESDEKLGRTWVDKEKGIFEYPYTTDLFLFQRK